MISKFRTPIRLQKSVPSEFNEPGAAWVDAGLGQAEIMDVLPSRPESVDEGVQRVRAQARVRMRYRDDITAGMRIVVLGRQGQAYEVVSMPAVIGESRSEIEFMVERYI